MNRKKLILIIFFSFLILNSLILLNGENIVKADTAFETGLNKTADKTGHTVSWLVGKDMIDLVGPLFVTIFIGVSFLCYILYAGFLWMTARGDAQQVEKAKTVVKNAIFGLIAVLGAYAITWFIVKQLRFIWGG